MIATVFRHPCGQLRVRFDTGLFWYPVVMQDVPDRCRKCPNLKPMPDGRQCCEASGVGETRVTADDIRRFALEKWRGEQEAQELARNAERDREGGR